MSLRLMESLDREIEAKYEILAKMGQGGMGSVYKVRHKYLGDVRVIKTMRSPDREAHKQRFISEAKRGYQFRHESIARVLDFAVTSEGTAYIVMEYIDGVDVRQALANAGGTLPSDRVIDIGVQTLGALAYLHERGVVHRDISPDNLMLARVEGNQTRVKLIDLGIAKSIQDSQNLTLAGKFVGKVVYAAPEQLSGEVDFRSDLYSLGVVLYELLTGTLPFRSTDYRAVMMAHISGELVPFSETDTEARVGPAMRAVVARVLQRDPAMRYQSAADFRTALESIVRIPAEHTMTVEISAAMPEAVVDRAEQAAWEAARIEDSAAAFDAFLEQYPESIHASEAHERREVLDRLETTAAARARESEQRAWAEASAADSTASWRGYLAVYPRSRRLAEARTRLAVAEEREKEWEKEQAAWTAAEASGSSAAWRVWVEQFATSPRRTEAEKRLSEAVERELEAEAWAASERESTSRAWGLFVDAHPSSPRIAEAKRRLARALVAEAEQRDFEAAAREDSAVAWAEFIANHGAAARLGDARSRLAAARSRDEEESAWSESVRLDSAERWHAFIAQHGSSARISEARARLAAAREREEAQQLEEERRRADAESKEWNAAADADSAEAWKAFLSAHPRSARAADAQERLRRAAARAGTGAAAPQRITAPGAPRRGSEQIQVERRAAERVRTAWRAYRDGSGVPGAGTDERLQIAKRREEENDAWRAANEIDSSERWREFLERWPDSERAADAKKRLALALDDEQEQREFEAAARADSIAAWEQFVAAHPAAIRIAEARKRLSLARAAAQQQA